MVKFSIVTVCFNANDVLESTIKSVLLQDYDNYEYIIVDGASTDGTLDIIKSYAEGNEKIKYISEPDAGLYDAMNKGAAMANGDYVQFLNAGDELASDSVLSDIANAIDEYSLKCTDEKNIFYGNIVYVYPDGSEDVRMYGSSCGKAIYFATGDCVNHQACFTARECFEACDFDYKKYKICADRDFMMKQTKLGASWVATGVTVVRYDLSEDSISVRDKELLKKEERMSLKDNYPAMLPIYLMFDFCRNNKVLARVLHSVYKLLYIRK